MAGFTAFYDADVLYGSQLCNLMLHLALTGLFRAKWSAGVHEEWMTRLLRNRPDLTREKLERTRMLRDKHAEDALVTGYEDLIEGLRLPGPNDHHVPAAAIRGCADVIVPRNVRDFPADVLGPLGAEAQHPDVFIVHLLDFAQGLVIDAARRPRESLKNPTKATEHDLETLEAEGLTETVAILREYTIGGGEPAERIPDAFPFVCPVAPCAVGYHCPYGDCASMHLHKLGMPLDRQQRACGWIPGLTSLHER